MAAEATFTLRAVDATRQAFASVQNSLQKIHGTTRSISMGLKGFFGLGAVVSLGKSLNTTLEDIEANSKKFGLSSEQVDKVTRATGAVDDVMNFFKGTIVGTINKVLDLKDAMFGVSKVDAVSIADKIRLDRDAPKIDDAKKQLDELKKSLNEIGQTPAQKFRQLFKDFKEIQAKPSDPAKSSTLNALEKDLEVQKLINAQRTIATDQFEQYTKAVADHNKVYDEYNFSLLTEKEQQTEINRQLNQLVNLRRADEDLLKNFDPAKATVAQLEAMDRMLVTLPKINELLAKRKVIETDLEKIAKSAGDIISSGFEDAIFSGQKLGEVIKAIGMDLMRMVFQQTVTAPLAKGISTAILAGFRANGGPVTGGSAYVVGERGPELFIPNGSGSIVSNSNMNQGGRSSGASINVNYNIAAGVTRSELAPILEQERRRLKAEIPDMVRRGGAYRSAFA
jgi:uncharacterized membrane-anchored protein YhcB (DUF1043 family)